LRGDAFVRSRWRGQRWLYVAERRLHVDWLFRRLQRHGQERPQRISERNARDRRHRRRRDDPCTFTFPLPTLPTGGEGSPACDEGLRLFVTPASACTPIQSPGATGESCQPVEGQAVEMLSVAGTPAQLRVRQTVDGVVILDESAMPVYAIDQPNGAQCGPTCHEAGASWTLANLPGADGGSD
jgi:hypothetical protein